MVVVHILNPSSQVELCQFQASLVDITSSKASHCCPVRPCLKATKKQTLIHKQKQPLPKSSKTNQLKISHAMRNTDRLVDFCNCHKLIINFSSWPFSKEMSFISPDGTLLQKTSSGADRECSCSAFIDHIYT